MKLIIMILFTLMMALPALADETPPATEPPAATGESKTPAGADPCTSGRAAEGETTGTTGPNGNEAAKAVDG